MNNVKLFVLIRKNLSISQQAVQAGHCVAQFLLERPDASWKNGTLVYLGVKDLEELERWIFKLDHKFISWVGFKEPDLNNEYTAIAIEGHDNMFSKLELI